MAHRTYLRTMGVTFTLVCTLAALINYLVDPYGLFGVPRIDGLNARKPAAADRVRIVKPYQVRRMHPRTLIGGNSRPEAGIDPRSPCWSADDAPVYNLGLPGASLYTQQRYLQSSLADGGVELLLLGVDLLDFLVPEHRGESLVAWPAHPEPFENRLGHRADGSANARAWQQALQDGLTALFSLETLGDSLWTLYSQRNLYADDRRADGFNPAQNYRPIVAAEGQAVLFVQKNREVVERLRSQQVLFQDNSNWSEAFEALERLLRTAKDTRTKVILFINPYHAEYLAAVARNGRWSDLEAWKRRLVQVVAKHHQSDGGDVLLWDFNGFDAYSTEPAPSPGDTQSMLRWFWEPAHYRSEFGNLMLAAMLETSCSEPLTTGLPGVRLSSVNIEDHLAQLRAARNDWLARHPSEPLRLDGRGTSVGHEAGN
jgi:hypothetical protein